MLKFIAAFILLLESVYVLLQTKRLAKLMPYDPAAAFKLTHGLFGINDGF